MVEPVRILVTVRVGLAESDYLRNNDAYDNNHNHNHLVCPSFKLIKKVSVAKLCCVQDQGGTRHCVVEPGHDDHDDDDDDNIDEDDSDDENHLGEARSL